MTAPEPFATDATLADAGEFGLIAVLAQRFGQGAHVYVGPGDDAAVLRTPKGHVVVSTDLLVEGRHFRREWAPARDVGRKAAAADLSDIKAMGGAAQSPKAGGGDPPGHQRHGRPRPLPHGGSRRPRGPAGAVGARPRRRHRRGGRPG